MLQHKAETLIHLGEKFIQKWGFHLCTALPPLHCPFISYTMYRYKSILLTISLSLSHTHTHTHTHTRLCSWCLVLIGSLVETHSKSHWVAMATKAKIKQPSRQQRQPQLAHARAHTHTQAPLALAPRNRHKMSSILERRGRKQRAERETSRQSGRGGDERVLE